ncbi:hypothetical protein KIL84_000737 [Mauremys mutica]|uniref:Uncharacterized protein n=1 Tax=Mauremys mutica TaxID=74926 RepID=A0A9D4ANQ5_9SAUR|nr:hypothetical protein KIL84_000737 [Mauremys mutica]
MTRSHGEETGSQHAVLLQPRHGGGTQALPHMPASEAVPAGNTGPMGWTREKACVVPQRRAWAGPCCPTACGRQVTPMLHWARPCPTALTGGSPYMPHRGQALPHSPDRGVTPHAARGQALPHSPDRGVTPHAARGQALPHSPDRGLGPAPQPMTGGWALPHSP